jgi:NADH:ubiquinone oxidoreductase subunit C
MELWIDKLFFMDNKLNIITKKTKYLTLIIFNILNIYIYGLKLNPNMICLYVNVTKIINILIILKKNSITRFDKLADIVVVDNVSNLFRFEISYIFWNIAYEYRFIVKLFNDGLRPIYSVSNYYKSALWLEREIWDMYGVKFLFHLGLRRILSDYGFKGHPLRKDFPLTGYVDVYFDDATQSIKVSPLELAQSLRFFKFENPWHKWYL